ncbi:bifunctional diguanylate cyclase/phosphodiesterase [Kangiella sediminilitoris]|uniref:Diguanylate cyclase/phosphodiesterase with PAS/PAC and GAF sensor(S) n=1 Tax=Kangiella sediminilitoris TaxID=1144748 RepID=A0A1B3BBN7_9GAMM|nr:EAL domain-containing protein [Kangiella sediminilitoris]AOE50202.1 Diguanylate cyclase/phosphodiesterase with PAS/PAC and GAF sensor(S) [Kangiella sediminilitoris]
MSNLTTDNQFLFDLSQSLLASETVQQTADIVVQALQNYIKSYDCAFFRFEQAHNQLICVSYTCRNSPELASYKLKPIPLGAGVVGHAAEEKRTMNIANSNDCDFWLEYVEGNVAELTVPVIYQGKLLAVIDLEDDHEGYFEDSTEQLVQDVASLISTFLYNQLKHEDSHFKLEQMDYSERSSKSKESYFSMLLEQLGDPVFILSPSGKIIDLNQSAILSLGYAKNELVGQRIQRVERLLKSKTPTQLYKLLKHDETLVAEGVHTRKDGSSFYVEVKFAQLNDGNVVAVARDISKRREVTDKLESSRAFLQELIKMSPDVMYTYDLVSHKLVMGGKRLAKLLGYTGERLSSWDDALNLTHPDDLDAMKSRAKRLEESAPSETIVAKARIKNAKGEYRLLQNHCLILKRDDFGKPVLELGSIRDITEEDRLEQELEQRENYYRALVENAFDGIALYDVEGNIMFSSSSALKLLGYEVNDVKGLKAIDFVHADDIEMATKAWKWVLNHPGKVYRIPEYRILKKSGEAVWVENTFINLLHDSNVKGIISNFRDISYKKISEQSLYKISNYDSLTELPNRFFLKQQLQRYISQAHSYRHKVTLIYFDVIQLNVINSALGPWMGDKVLQYVVTTLGRHTEEFDFIARAGDDEFVIVLNQKDAFEAGKVVEKILSEFDTLVTIGGSEVKVSLRAGVVRFPDDGSEAEELLNKAEITARRVKDMPEQFSFYQPEVTELAKDKLMLEKEIVNAINQDQLMLYYQPKVCLKTGEIDSLEALLRWEHPVKGFISPQLIISIAEESSLIYRLTNWVITQAIEQISLWAFEGMEIKVSVNLSVKDLLREELKDNIADTLKQFNVSPSLLDVEVTESAALADMERSVSILQELKSMGVTISLDDFGTGYSSISHLTSLPVDQVKIDQSFIQQVNPSKQEGTQGNRQIIKNIIRLARSFKLTSIVEGVETQEQLDILKDFSCDLAQGYLFSHPVPAADVPALVSSGKLMPELEKREARS